MNTATNTANSSARAPISNERAEDMRWAISLVEDWLLHASTETLDELADFTYGPAQHGHDSHDQLRWIIDLLGEASVRLRPTPQPSTQPVTAERGPGR